jgi:hypothetical protein
MKQRLIEVGGVVAELSWRGFGLLLFILPSSAGVGAFVSGSWVIGVLTAWGTLMLGVVGAIGYAIATTGKASKVTVQVAVQDAVKKTIEEDKGKK